MQTYTFDSAQHHLARVILRDAPTSSATQRWLETIIWEGYQGLAHSTPQDLEDDLTLLTQTPTHVGPRPSPLAPGPRLATADEERHIRQTLIHGWTHPLSRSTALAHATIWAFELSPQDTLFLPALPNHHAVPCILWRKPDQWLLPTLTATPSSSPSRSSAHPPLTASQKVM